MNRFDGVMRAAFGLALSVLAVTGCSLDGLLNSDELPPDVSDPAITQTPDGARSAYNGTLAEFRTAFAGSGDRSFVVMTGLLGDELLSFSSNAADSRTLPEGAGAVSDETYSKLQRVRGQASQAIGLLTRYLPEQTPLVGHMYALQGYAEVFLAELYCSGVPLGTLDYKGDFTYRPGSSTTEVFAHATALFDTALALAGDSMRFLQLAKIGRGRALLAMGNYAAAAAAVADAPDDYSYAPVYSTATTININGTQSSWKNFAALGLNNDWRPLTVPDGEGQNGSDWVASGDPRARVTGDSFVNGGHYDHVYHPDKYATDGSGPVILASGVEARLIEAEAALKVGDTGTWLTKLNALRTDGTYDTTETSPPDTLWHAGTGGVAGLRPLTDPGTDAGRVDLLFRERGFWLFLTGHRQGDLRRLIRQYGRLEGDVYPVGPYPADRFPYGADVTAPIPSAEFANPLYTGCASRGA